MEGWREEGEGEEGEEEEVEANNSKRLDMNL